MKDKKIGIITFHDANNYGAVLQAVATVFIFGKKDGYEAHILDYYNPTISDQLDKVRFGRGGRNFLRLGKDVIRIFNRMKVVKRYKKFIKENCNLTSKCKSKEDLSEAVRGYSYLVSGSDQIWNPECQDESYVLNSVYFLDFGDEETKRISYATSFGDYDFNEREIREIKIYLDKFEDISIREESSSRILSNKINRNISVVLDPTLLMSKMEWDRISSPVLGLEKEFVLIYLLNRNSLNKSAVEKIKKENGGKSIVVIDQSISKAYKGTHQIRDAGPAEFIWLFSNAQFIVTDSFHGCCFSINFDKRFMAVKPPKRINRITDLLSAVGLEDRFIGSIDDLDGFSMEQNVIEAREKLEKLKLSSLEFIDKNII